MTENTTAVTVKRSVPRFAGRVSANSRLAETLGGGALAMAMESS